MTINDLPQPILEEYNKIISKFTDEQRLPAFNNLRKFAEEKTQYLTTPASTKYHMCCKHGLLLHSMSVTDTMFKLRDSHNLQDEISDSQIVLVAMFHDLGKVGESLSNPMYIENQPTERQKQYGYPANPPYLFNQNIKTHLEHAHNSLYLITKFMSLSREEFQAILIHDGVGIDTNKVYNMKECKLAWLLHEADKTSTLFFEVRN